MVIRYAQKEDLQALLALYTHLHGNPMPVVDEKLEGLWASIIKSPSHFILLGEDGGRVVSSCVLLIVPNLTHGQRPYALVENVVTHPELRGRGYATRLLKHAQAVAQRAGCYKIMLMTGAKEEAVFSFYERAGFNRQDKTAFIKWLDEPDTTPNQ